MLQVLKYIIKNLHDFSKQDYKESFSYMTSLRKEKVIRYKDEDRKKCTLAGEFLVRQLLSDTSGKTKESFIISADKNGKLFCENQHDLYFNISHSNGMVAAVISDEEVGIDLEVIRPYPLALTKKICNEEELLYIFGHLPDETEFTENASKDTLHRFFEVWTAKEAYLKCIGTGFSSLSKLKSLSLDFPKTKIKTEEYVIHIVKVSNISSISIKKTV